MAVKKETERRSAERRTAPKAAPKSTPSPAAFGNAARADISADEVRKLISEAAYYRAKQRGFEPGQSYCSCPDYRKNTLGTCKHILFAARRLRRRHSPAALRRPYARARWEVYVRYGSTHALRVGQPRRASDAGRRILGPLVERDVTDVQDLVRRLARLESAGESGILHHRLESLLTTVTESFLGAESRRVERVHDVGLIDESPSQVSVNARSRTEPSRWKDDCVHEWPLHPIEGRRLVTFIDQTDRS